MPKTHKETKSLEEFQRLSECLNVELVGFVSAQQRRQAGRNKGFGGSGLRFGP